MSSGNASGSDGLATNGWTFIDGQVIGNELVLAHKQSIVNGRSASRLRPSRFAEAAVGVARRVTETGLDVDIRVVRRSVPERHIGRGVRGIDGAVHSVAVWVGSAELNPPEVPQAGAWTWVPDRRITYWSDELCSLYGLESASRRNRSIHEFLQMLGPEDAINVARVLTEVDEAEPDQLVGETFWVPSANQLLRRFHSFGRIVESAEHGRLWRGTSIDVTGFDGAGSSNRSILGMLHGQATGTQSALVELPNLRLLRWIGQGLPEVDWPTGGELTKAVMISSSDVNALDADRIAALPPTQAQSLPVRLKTRDGQLVRAQMRAQILDEPAAVTPALVVIHRT
ncbi:hypothetical protein [Nocardia sp. NPDC058705]|uniref:hypothetical protein n=1 Tax=Nocardia sp. NPDC058705 TaxID=3346609 RepID=UPI0036B664EC